jgi:hypothetical protein
MLHTRDRLDMLDTLDTRNTLYMWDTLYTGDILQIRGILHTGRLLHTGSMGHTGVHGGKSYGHMYDNSDVFYLPRCVSSTPWLYTDTPASPVNPKANLREYVSRVSKITSYTFLI